MRSVEPFHITGAVSNGGSTVLGPVQETMQNTLPKHSIKR